MNRPGGQRRALNQIEKALADDHPGLGPLFAIFADLAVDEEMPLTERIAARPWRLPRRLWATAVTVAGLAMFTVALFVISLTLSSRQTCAPATATSAAVHAQPVRARSQRACATRPSEPDRTSQIGFYGP